MWNEIKSFFVSARRTSREEAKGRLHLVIAHDRAGIDGAKLQELRAEVAAVIRKYVEIDPEAVEIHIERVSRDDSQLRVNSPLPPRGTVAIPSTE
jgi:cell division topological specificity factor